MIPFSPFFITSDVPGHKKDCEEEEETREAAAKTLFHLSPHHVSVPEESLCGRCGDAGSFQNDRYHGEDLALLPTRNLVIGDVHCVRGGYAEYLHPTVILRNTYFIVFPVHVGS